MTGYFHDMPFVMGRQKAVDDHGSEGADSRVNLAMTELGRILMEIAETAGETPWEGKPGAAGPLDSKTKAKRQSNQRRVKGGQRRDRKPGPKFS